VAVRTTDCAVNHRGPLSGVIVACRSASHKTGRSLLKKKVHIQKEIRLTSCQCHENKDDDADNHKTKATLQFTFWLGHDLPDGVPLLAD